MSLKHLMICAIMSVFICMSANAQIGYQISLLNTATGEPRANETVNVTATITDSSGGVIYTGTQSVTSNDFGVLSLSVGNADTFTSFDLQEHRLPFFIEVSANGAMISRSQILSVPVAEVARQVEPGIKVEDIVGTWNIGSDLQITFNPDMTAIYDCNRSKAFFHYNGHYLIDGNNIVFYSTYSSSSGNYYYNNCILFRLINGNLYVTVGDEY